MFPFCLVSIPQWCDCCQLNRPQVVESHDVSIPQWCDCCRQSYTNRSSLCRFQSHNGAIAARDAKQKCERIACFNPTMVRLLRPEKTVVSEMTRKFQSHNGAIAARFTSRCRSENSWYQSHNGAIAAGSQQVETDKAAEVSIPQWCDCCRRDDLCGQTLKKCFNPTMVRLLHLYIESRRLPFKAFQSHNGAIAAKIFRSNVAVEALFQSHNGAIAATVKSPCLENG